MDSPTVRAGAAPSGYGRGMVPEAPIRVWHVRNSDRFGGPERLIADQCALAAPEYEMVVLSFGAEDEPHAFLDAAAARGVPTRRVPQASSYDPRLVRRVRKAIEAEQPALLVGHDYKADLLLRMASRGSGLPRVAVVHGYTGENLKIRLFEALDKRLLRKMDAVVVVSEALRAELIERGVQPDRIHLVPNAVDVVGVAAAAEAGREAVRREWEVGGDFVLLALGRLSPEKGQDVLLEAFAGWAPPGEARVKLVLVGDGATREALTRQAEKLGLSERVHFAGWRADPHACLGAADGIVMPSRTEGLPLAALEAMAASRPVVATRVGGLPEVLDEGRAGWLAEPEDVAGLREALTAMCADADERVRRVATARERVATLYGAERQARALEAVYRRVLTQG